MRIYLRTGKTNLFKAIYKTGNIYPVITKIGSGSDAKYTHSQDAASDTWTVNHNLGKYPSVTVVDSANSVVIGDIDYTSLNSLTVAFSAAFSGKVYCN
jgi:hypothetical protein